MIALVIVRITNTWVYQLIILKMPAYMESVLRMSLEANGYFSAAMSVSSCVSIFLCGIVADFVIQKRYFASKTTVRKLFEGIVTFGSSFFLVLIPTLVHCNRTLFLLTMMAVQVAQGMISGGEIPLPADMSADFSATIFGIGNMFGMITGFVGPYFTGLVLDAAPEQPMRQWAYVIYFTAALNVVGGIVFTLLGSAEPLDW